MFCCAIVTLQLVSRKPITELLAVCIERFENVVHCENIKAFVTRHKEKKTVLLEKELNLKEKEPEL